jgi:lipid-A-disaccharide synthase
MPGSTLQRSPARADRLRVGLIAGEASGDLLGAGLVRELRRIYPDALFEGVAGPAMLAEGVHGWLPMERLSVMGLAEVLSHLPELLRIRRRVTGRLLDWHPDVVVGIDSPDFTLAVERRLRAAGIRTVHYVSPSVWAWRAGRIHGIARSADLVLCLLPFEPPIYQAHGIPAEFVGHPMADTLPLVPDRSASRAALGLSVPDRDGTGEVLALLPGSRHGEVSRLGGDFAAAAARLAAMRPGMQCIAAMASPTLRERFAAQLSERAPGLEVRLYDGRSREVMAAADLVMLASGTATLEAALLKRPMVVAYRVAGTTFRLVRSMRLIKVRRFALPNLLAGEDLVPELIQDEVTPERLAAEAVALLDDAPRRARLVARFAALHELLRRNADRRAAEAVLRLTQRLPEPLA